MNFTKKSFTLCFVFLFAYACGLPTLFAQSSNSKFTSAANAQAEQAELKAALALAPAERILKLKAFIEAHPLSKLSQHAAELIVSARAALGDEKLKAGDAAGGTEQFRLAIAESPLNASEKLFLEVISQIPTNLFLRGEAEAAMQAALDIEARVKDDPKRLLALAGFYLGIERGDEAGRLAELAIKLAPEMAAAHQALGAARHISLRLDEAATEYARALELDPNSTRSRRSLADLRRATGKPEEALTLYQAQLKLDPSDKISRSGIVLSLFDLEKKDEAERELAALLKDEPRHLAVMVGAAYWYAVHNEGARARELAQQAVSIESRYTWAQIALARAQLATKHPLEAERALRVAQQYGRFPTLDYELANALAASGFYEEAADQLAQSFNIKDAQIETQLAGRIPAQSANFIELLAPERRASIFQPLAADTNENARMLKALLAFKLALHGADGKQQPDVRETEIAAREFASGTDAMRVYRQLYVASRLVQARVALPLALELTNASIGGVEEGLNVPAPTFAILADELRDIRRQANAAGESAMLTEGSRNVLSNVLRGRIEDLTGWALFNLDKPGEAVLHLQRAVSVFPANTFQWRESLWHLGAAQQASGNAPAALEAYLKSYNRDAPDALRRKIIEALYRKINGSLAGLDARLGAEESANVSGNSSNASNAVAMNDTLANTQPPAPSSTPAPTATTEPSAVASSSQTTSTAPLTSEPASVLPTPTATSGSNDTAASTVANNSAPPDNSATATPTPEASPSPQPEATPRPTPTPTPAPVAPTSKPATPAASGSAAAASCVTSASTGVLTITNNGGAADVTITLQGIEGAGEVKVQTPFWADIAVFPKPRGDRPANTFEYSITSTSKKAGTFFVTFKSICGARTVIITVQ